MTDDDFWNALSEKYDEHHLYRVYADFLSERETQRDDRLAAGLRWLADNGKYPNCDPANHFDWWTDYSGLLSRMQSQTRRRVTFQSVEDVSFMIDDVGMLLGKSCKLPLCRLMDTYGWFTTAGLPAASVIVRGAIAIAIDVLEIEIDDTELRSDYGSTRVNC